MILGADYLVALTLILDGIGVDDAVRDQTVRVSRNDPI